MKQFNRMRWKETEKLIKQLHNKKMIKSNNE